MPVRFKFRSSVEFDSVDLDGRSSISVRDLRVRIVERKKFKLCRDFSIVISDGETDEEYKDDECLIPDGSSVIIKRVPVAAIAHSQIAGSAVNHTAKNLAVLLHPPSQNVESVDFGDFGNAIYPVVCASSLNSDSDAESTEQGDTGAGFSPRFSEVHIARFQNFDNSHLSEDLLKDHVDENCDKACNFKENTNGRNHACNVEKKLLNKKLDMYPQVMVNSNFSMELKCSLCNTIFKEAVMIPCCQHSFCYKCICSLLLETSSCPKCFSAEYGIDDLLPNLSLRKAIEHIHGSQARKRCLDELVLEDVPDEESGIQGKDFSCAVSICQQERKVLDSPTATGMGSNLVVAESVYDKPKGVVGGTHSRAIHLNTDKCAELIPPGMKQEEVQDRPSMLKILNHMDESQGCVLKAATLQQRNEGKLKSALPATIYRKGNRNCYMCGSPDHLLKDCPASSNSYSMFATGNPLYSGGMPAYQQCYWNKDQFPHGRSYVGLYGTPGTMSYDPTIFPLIPFALPSYMPSIYSGLPASWVSGMEKQPSNLEVFEHHISKCKSRPHNEHMERRSLDDNAVNVMLKRQCYDSRKRSCANEHRSYPNTSRNQSSYESLRSDEKPSCNRIADSPRYHRSENQSEEELSKNGYLKKADYPCSRKDSRTHCSEKSFSEIGVPSDCFNRDNKEGKRYKNRRSSKKHSERGNDRDIVRSSHHKCSKNMSNEKALDIHLRHRRTHKTHKDSALDHEPGHRTQHRKEKKHIHCSRHSEDKGVYAKEHATNDRWEMPDTFHGSYIDDRHYLKRRRTR